LFEPELPQPVENATTASTERARQEVNDFPTQPAQRHGPRLSRCGTVAAEIGLGRAVEILEG
jgi:hypothetical protein